MRLLIVTHYFADHQGGVEIVACQLARRLARRGVEVKWTASGPLPQSTDPGVMPIAMRAWNGCEHRWGVPYPVWSYRSLRRLWAETAWADVIHLHDSLYLGNFFAFLFATWRGKPLIVTQHVGHIPFRNRCVQWLLRFGNRTVGRLVLTYAAAVIFISQQTQAYFSGFVRFRGPVRLIPNGVDTSVFNRVSPARRAQIRSDLGWSPERLYLLFVGRFVEKKGLPLLRQLAVQFPQCTWVFVGWGPLSPEEWKLDNVICPGRLPQHELPRYYRAADLLMLPSVGEGFPLVVQESMACGLPACLNEEVADALPDVRQHVLSAAPSVAAMAAIVQRILEQPQSLQSLRAVAADFAERTWDWERCVEEYQTLLEGLVASPVPLRLSPGEEVSSDQIPEASMAGTHDHICSPKIE